MKRSTRIIALVLMFISMFSFSGISVYAEETVEPQPRYTEVSEFVKTVKSTVVSKSIQQYDIIKNQNPKHFLSVARGQTITRQVSFDIEYQLTCSAEAAVDAAIKASFGLGSGLNLKLNFVRTDTFVGPNAPYSSRNYYGAISYDQYKIVLRNTNRYNVYRLVNGQKQFVRTEERTDNYTQFANIPKQSYYSVDT
ncbi:hypothetical protein H6A12_11890 [Phocea massiliensis]|uniref:Uncharacterized protein n=1 Tax=Merdimmobilis hominis TaxID=2897707 RepID=A0A939BE81_9FIRM|nr:hypothetical protein [Merdimmobilis hominis]MBM6921849.1 hypothetical protein [Merdimmobilis hominis]